MKKRAILALILVVAVQPMAQAGGTQDQETACLPDTRRFCSQLQPSAGDNAFLACLQQNRARLSPKCRRVLESNGV